MSEANALRKRKVSTRGVFFLVASGILSGLFSTVVLADHVPAPPDVNPYDPTFNTSGQSMWGAGTTQGPAGQNLDLVSLGWNEGGATRNVTHVSIPDLCLPDSVVDGVCEAACFVGCGGCCTVLPCSCGGCRNSCTSGCTNAVTRCVSDAVSLPSGDFGGGIGASTTGDIGAFFDMGVLGAGTVDVTYPVGLTVLSPAQDSFRAGDVVTIDYSNCNLLPGHDLSTLSPDGSLDLVGQFGLTASASAEICLFDCVSFNFFPPIDFTDNGQPFEATLISLSEGNVDPITSFALGLSGSWDLPQVETTSEAVGKNLMATGQDHFVDLSVDMDLWLIRVLSLGTDRFLPPLGVGPINIGGAQAGYEIVDVELTFDMFQDQTFNFTPHVQTVLQFAQSVDYTVDLAGGGTSAGNGQVVTINLGDRVNVVAQDAVIDVTPLFQITSEPNFSNETTTTFSQSIELTVLELTLVIPSFTIVPSNTLCVLGQCIPGQNFPGIDLGTLGPLFEDSFPVYAIVDEDNFDGNTPPWELQGFNSPQGSAFAIDPEFQPVAGITALSTATVGQPFLADATNSTDRDNDPLLFTWDFGDGTPTVMGDVVVHTYADNGVYTVTLTADDGHELPGVTTQEVIVSCYAVWDLRVEQHKDDGDEDHLGKLKFRGTFNPGLAVDPSLVDVKFVIIDQVDGDELEIAIPAGKFASSGGPHDQKYRFRNRSRHQARVKAEFDLRKCEFKLDVSNIDTSMIDGPDVIARVVLGPNVGEEPLTARLHRHRLDVNVCPKPRCCPEVDGDEDSDSCGDDDNDHDSDSD